MYFIISNPTEYIKESNENKSFALTRNDES